MYSGARYASDARITEEVSKKEKCLVHNAVLFGVVALSLILCGCGVIRDDARADVASMPGPKERAQPPAPQKLGPPRISVEEKNVNLGDWPAQVQLSHVFKLKNTGGEPLDIKVLSKSCSCISTILGADRIASGESGEIRLELPSDSTTRLRTGPQGLEVVLGTNDPNQTELSLSLRASLVLPVEVQPAVVQFGSLKPRERASQEFTVLCRQSEPTAKVIQVTATSPSLRITPKGQTQGKDGIGTLYVADFLGSATEGDEPNVIRVATDSAVVPLIEVPVHLKIQYQLVVHPQRFVFTRTSSSNASKRAIELVRNDPQVATPTRVTCTNPFIEASVEGGQTSSTWRVVMTVLEGAPDDSFRTELEIQSASAELLAVVPVYISPKLM